MIGLLPMRTLLTETTLAIMLFCGAFASDSTAESKDTAVRVPIGAAEAVFRLIHPKADGIDYPDFYVLETEVTNQQYKQFLTESKRSKDDSDVLEIVKKREASGEFSTGDVPYRVEDPASIWKNGQYPQGQGSFPVSLVTLQDAQDFCTWLSTKHPTRGLFRLPTWNEWMIAAYGRNRKYPWGNDWDRSKVHMSYGYEYPKFPKRAEDVKARGAGKTPQGLYGMLGNVAEFIDEADPTNRNYFNLGARWMGGGFTEGAFSNPGDHVQPRQDYWGYSHHSTLRECDLGFRVLLDPSKDRSLLERRRVFDQENKAWMTDDK
jgi:formylglycine-generating enzyme required for sulfatase activity